MKRPATFSNMRMSSHPTLLRPCRPMRAVPLRTANWRLSNVDGLKAKRLTRIDGKSWACLRSKSRVAGSEKQKQQCSIERGIKLISKLVTKLTGANARAVCVMKLRSEEHTSEL